MNNMNRIKILDTVETEYGTVRLISKTYNVKYYDPFSKDIIIEFHIQIKIPYMIIFNKWKTIKLYTYYKSTDSYKNILNKAITYFNNICSYG